MCATYYVPKTMCKIYRLLLICICLLVLATWYTATGNCIDILGKKRKEGEEYETIHKFCKTAWFCNKNKTLIGSQSRCLRAPKLRAGCRLVPHPDKEKNGTLYCCDVVVCHECRVGTYGWNSTCSGRCHCRHTNVSCAILSGSCAKAGGCELGYYGAPNCGKRACEDGLYMHGFRQRCIGVCHCVNQSLCHPGNGSCARAGGCAPGYKGARCHAECSPGTYGHKCSKKCHCVTSSKCDHVTGSCDRAGGCAAGWYGTDGRCINECPNGKFGRNCGWTCNCGNRTEVCHKGAGSCPVSGCGVGYMGRGCQQACTNRTFGQGCSGQCNCRNASEKCDVITGACRSGCVDGRQPPDCQSDCVNMTFGPGCMQKCHCKNVIEPCYKSAGVCYSNCTDVWTGKTCQIPVKVHITEEANTDDDLPLPMIIGGTIGVLVIVVVVALLIFVLRRRRIRRGSVTKRPSDTPSAARIPMKPPTSSIRSHTSGHVTRAPPTQPEDPYQNIDSITDKTPVQETGDNGHYEGYNTPLDENDYLILSSEQYTSLAIDDTTTTGAIPLSHIYSDVRGQGGVTPTKTETETVIGDKQSSPEIYENVANKYENIRFGGAGKSGGTLYENIRN